MIVVRYEKEVSLSNGTGDGSRVSVYAERNGAVSSYRAMTYQNDCRLCGIGDLVAAVLDGGPVEPLCDRLIELGVTAVQEILDQTRVANG